VYPYNAKTLEYKKIRLSLVIFIVDIGIISIIPNILKFKV